MTKEQRFFELIKKAAAEKNAVFFMDSGEGNEIIDDLYDGEDLSGWLIPENLVEQFKQVRENEEEWKTDDWLEFYCFAEWHKDAEGKVFIEFNSYD